jgi:Formylmethanofuran dehydrogenase subunit E
MDPSQLPADLRRAYDFHGHLCPGIMIGWRAARAAQAALGLSAAKDEELTTVAENDSCSVDAFQALLSTTFGKGNLKWVDNGKQVFTVTDRRQNRAVRVSFVGDKLKTRLPDGSTDREAFMQVLLSAPDEDVVEVLEVPASPPGLARIEPSQPCARCGELVQRSRLVGIGGEFYCPPCAREMGS